MPNPNISVIMGIYNCAATLDEAIKSILDQTYTGWKMIMCDDGSTDNTYDIASKYTEQYPDKFILIKNDKNMGLNYTLNHCLKYADTEYVARMDGDDISLPTRFEEEIEFLTQHPEYAFVGCSTLNFDQNGIYMQRGIEYEPTPNDLPKKGTPVCHPTCIIRKVALDDVDGYSVSKKLLRVEDFHLWIKLYAKGYKGYNLGKPLHMFRDDRNSTSRRKLKYRINESRVISLSIRTFKLSPINYVYALKPIILGIIPKQLYTFLHKRKQRRTLN